MIRATLHNGAIELIDPIPSDWVDGDTLEVATFANQRLLADEFAKLAARWKAETRLISSTTEIVTHPAYQRIIGMGFVVVPLILEELRREPFQWFWALRALTGENPVPTADRGNVPKMAEAWLRWGGDKGLIGNNESGK